ncbi:hypothetical protein CHGG_04696 [Chaetomium globosum CBS 148.51]|uniref:Mob1 family protein n=1 Tax=Chaetomium globosum (strain ATCC 6205 / CBS 148.51 / DSM 1962 / NBRC 6347 / NRRL 1970) TaxID=306901 RepID=Q2H0K0_CHAGB|nr:uncharacterized protein CHGG_04696 [Chaetomium globosum CBS 148.51]EAQ88077.1 hypothetical protein CHGG_04696 [Chaetomium globosum CBS 148.51]
MSLPPSSPRLPSPPPPAEIQRTPKSPLMGPNAARQAAQIEQTAIDTNAKRRIHPGTKSADMAAGPPLVPLHEEHLAALHYHHTSSHTTPISRDTAKLLATPPPGIDKTLWLYELCRFLIAQCNTLIVGFLFDTPPCSAATCPEMRAGEWQFLCAVHDAPKSCCAIDYCCHTLDWATNIVTNPKIFPSRFVVDAHDKNTALKNLVNVFRRLHRIFAHAWFQHRGVFWSVEGQGGLYVFFKTVCDVYDLLPAENYKLPPEAEGLDSNSGAADLGDRGDRRQQQQQPQLLGPISIAKPPSQRDGEDGDYSSVSRTNTRRHIKSSPSTGSAVTTVPEADEDDGSDLSHRLRGMRISAPPSVAEDERESATIPVIVEHKPLTAAEHPIRPPSVIPPPGAETGGSQVKQEPAPDVAMQEADTPGPEHDFATEPEAPAQTLPDSTTSEPKPEHQPEPESTAEPQLEEAQSATPAKEPSTTTAAAEEPAPETKPEPEEEASGKPESDAVTAEKPDAGDAPSYLPLTDDKKAKSKDEQTTESESAAGLDTESQATAAVDSEEDAETATVVGADEAGEGAPADDARSEADTVVGEDKKGDEEKPAEAEPTEEKKPAGEKGDQD